MSFCFTAGNVDDRKPMGTLFKGLEGIGCEDKGYISKEMAQKLVDKDLPIITKTKSNMRKITRSVFEKYLLAQRSILETGIEQLKSICQIEHSRHQNQIIFWLICLQLLLHIL